MNNGNTKMWDSKGPLSKLYSATYIQENKESLYGETTMVAKGWLKYPLGLKPGVAVWSDPN